MSWEGLNRRKFPRAYFPCFVKIGINGKAEDGLLTHTENISTGGICVILRKSVERFALVNVEIDLMDGEEHILCQGKAMWVVRRKAIDPLKPSFYDIGIEYVGLKEESRQQIAKVVVNLAKNQNRVIL
ncbi:MAG: PilZ domain-containing protein [Candidatus Omnitrophica bacterium]|nr:PilZ domain-containing protein [Candidatus Omnitrophota bacterium]